MVFDNGKIKRLVPDFVCRIPFSRGAEEILAWYDADPGRRKVNEDFNRVCDRILTACESCRPKS
jgi:hypothetical protein